MSVYYVEPVVCFHCGELILPGEDLDPGTLWVDGKPTKPHRECSLRAVIGGIGHLSNHAFWCVEKHDPDAGLTYRESALLVDQWVHDHGESDDGLGTAETP